METVFNSDVQNYIIYIDSSLSKTASKRKKYAGFISRMTIKLSFRTFLFKRLHIFQCDKD